MPEKLKKPERDLIWVFAGFFIVSFPFLISSNFAGLFYPSAREMYLLDYDWLVPKGEAACYSYVLDGQNFSNCTALDQSAWITVSGGDRSLRFFVNVSVFESLASENNIAITSLPGEVDRFQTVNFTYEITNGEGRGRVIKVSYDWGSEKLGGSYVRLYPGETKTVTDSFKAKKSGAFRFKVNAMNLSSSSQLNVREVWDVNPIMGVIAAFIAFLLPGYALSRKVSSGYAPLFSLTLILAIVAVLGLFEIFEREATWWVITALIGVGIVGFASKK